MQSVCHQQTTTQSAHCSDSPFVQDIAVPLTTSTVAVVTSTLPLDTSSTLPSDTPSVTTATSLSRSPTISETFAGTPSRSISTSSLLSEDPYGKKIEDLKELVQRLESELKAEKSKKKDTSTLVTCLAEVQAENRELHQQLAKLQAPNQTPQTTMNAAQAMDISNGKTQQEMEVQALREENCRLQALLQGSASEKDQEINRLNRCNAELTESMAEQTTSLKSRLNETAQMCQQLAGQLELGQSSVRTAGVTTQLQQLQVNGLDSVPVELKEENEQLKDQVTTLNTQLQEVIQMNTRWQSYNKQREEHLQTIKQKLKTMEDAASNTKPLPLTEQQQVEIDRIILQYKQKVQAAEEEKLKVTDENREFRLKVDRMMAEMLDKDNQIRNLQDQLVRKPTTGGAGGSRQDAERIQVLEHQVQLCTEDFESERHDRERAQTKIEELEQELRITRRQLDQFQGRQMEEMAERRRQALEYYRDEYSRTHPGYQNMQMVGRGGMIEADCPEGDDDLDEDGEGYDTVDCAGFAAGESAFSRLQQEDTLQCPKCKKEFPISKHEQLLEHTEECI